MTENPIITIYTFKDLLEASFAQSKLKSNMIESFLEDGNIIGLNPLGGVELKIFAKDIEKVKDILLI
jgi:hypothetical protein